MNLAQKLRAIRKAEGLTQSKFCEISGIALGTLKNYEGGHQEPGIQVIMQVTNTTQFEKYTLWLMTDKTAPESGQISPVVAHCGQEETTSSPSGRKIG
ncbi:TPA: helix-turn-helix transcriptional regulator [Enterobacter hormaechei subsp. xiangfangensis]|uniref:helix-turn-helix domain-containing protein n=1 Tax=Enterobacter asburiae TaxID=61645 RepID=UPI0007583501|nr:helix-turn-helix transcriptional regulator [Enterobacter asburiae]KVJ89418.1 repressor [Enterobacter asburiae]HED2942653.1 helix-turn-helix transcriptional regulator [Enterobacter hormaechei subsp. xiangfangensis]HED3552904.1 helix-turn-helix transcriptional regulator [Enterobacter hormaechei subsp. xiangfangensis]